MGLQEVVLCATAPQPSGSGSGPAQASGPGAFVLHDLQTSNVLSSFKQTSSAPHCSAFVETKDGQGGIMLAAQSDKALLNVYNFQKACISRRDRLPATDYRPTGPDRPKGGSAGKIDLSDSGSKVKILRWWYRSGTDIPLGGAFRFIFQYAPRHDSLDSRSPRAYSTILGTLTIAK